MKRNILIAATTLLIALILVACSNNNANNTNLDTEFEGTTESSIEYIDYTLNNITFSLPENWILDESSDYIMTFSKATDEKSLIYIKSEKIPDIMKIDVGDNSILTKDDVVSHYGFNNTYNVTQKNWKTANGFEFCETKLDGEEGCTMGCDIIPINTNEAVFSIFIRSSDEKDMKILDDVMNNIVL